MELTLILSISVLGLLFAAYLIRDVLRRDTGTPKMREISDAIKAGAEAFLSRQNRTIIYLAIALAASSTSCTRSSARTIEHDPASPGRSRPLDDTLVHPRRGLLGGRRVHGHVGGDPRQHPHGGRAPRKT